MFDAHGLTEMCVKIFEGVAKTTNWFVIPLFLLRVAYAQVLGNQDEIISALKGVVLYFLLIVGFGEILEVLFTLPQAFLPSGDFLIDFKDKLHGITENRSRDVAEQVSNQLKVYPLILSKLFEVIAAVLYWAVLGLHVFFMFVMSSLAPIVFLTACILGIGMGIRLFFGLLILASCWPAMWSGFDQALLWLNREVPDTFGRYVYELLVTFLKGIGPLGMAYFAINSGPGNSVVTGLKSTVGSGKMLHEFLSGTKKSDFQKRSNFNQYSMKHNGSNRIRSEYSTKANSSWNSEPNSVSPEGSFKNDQSDIRSQQEFPIDGPSSEVRSASGDPMGASDNFGTSNLSSPTKSIAVDRASIVTNKEVTSLVSSKSFEPSLDRYPASRIAPNPLPIGALPGIHAEGFRTNYSYSEISESRSSKSFSGAAESRLIQNTVSTSDSRLGGTTNRRRISENPFLNPSVNLTPNESKYQSKNQSEES